MKLYAKAIVALFAAPLTYVANQLAADEPVNAAALLSFCITAVLVWATPSATKG